MMHARGMGWLCAAPALCVFAAAAGSGRVPRDWAKFPAVVQLDTAAEIFAVGDVHGDYDRLVKLLAGNRIIGGVPPAPGKPVWTAGRAVVVFTGDLMDKGPRALPVMIFLSTLRAEAARAGGTVLVLMGNHEAEFLADPDKAKASEFAAELKSARLNPREVAACRGDVGQFLCTLPFAARVNDWFFSHAGNTDGRTVEALAAALQAGVDREGFGTRELAAANSLLEARVGERGPHGRSWFEAGAPRQDAQQLLAAYAQALHVRHIVEGHHHAETHFPDGALRRAGELYQWHGLLFFIDTGMSRGVGDSTGAMLRITQGGQPQASALCGDGRATVIWDAALPGESGGVGPCKVPD